MIKKLIRKGYVLEVWYSEGEYACMISRSSEPDGNAITGHARTLEKAVIAAERLYVSTFELADRETL